MKHEKKLSVSHTMHCHYSFLMLLTPCDTCTVPSWNNHVSENLAFPGNCESFEGSAKGSRFSKLKQPNRSMSTYFKFGVSFALGIVLFSVFHADGNVKVQILHFLFVFVVVFCQRLHMCLISPTSVPPETGARAIQSSLWFRCRWLILSVFCCVNLWR